MHHLWKWLAATTLVAAGGCSGTDVSNFKYGKDNPGADLPEGGDVRIERVYIADGMGHEEKPDGSGGVSWLQVYQWKSSDMKTTKALPPEGQCTELRTGNYWPNSKLDDPSITGVDLGASVKISGPKGDTLLPKCTTATNIGTNGMTSLCSTTSTPPRALALMYGGLSAGSPQGAFLNNIAADTVQAGATYTIDLGGKKTDSGGNIQVHIPNSYKTPLGIGASAVTVKGGQDLVLKWDPPANGSTGTDHTPTTTFGRLFVLDTTASNNGYPLSWVCVPKTDPSTGVEIDGEITVPASVVDKWPKTGGLLVHAELTHYMEAVDGRRLDLVGIWCHVSPFTVQ
jgi:hypothetical protein